MSSNTLEVTSQPTKQNIQGGIGALGSPRGEGLLKDDREMAKKTNTFFASVLEDRRCLPSPEPPPNLGVVSKDLSQIVVTGEESL